MPKSTAAPGRCDSRDGDLTILPRTPCLTLCGAIPQGLIHIAKTEGIKGMMKGNGANCVRIIPNSAVKFLAYEHISREISEYNREHYGNGQLTPFLRLVAGAGAGIIAMSATYPLDMVRGRLTVQGGTEYRGIIHAAQCIIRDVSAAAGRMQSDRRMRSS